MKKKRTSNPKNRRSSARSKSQRKQVSVVDELLESTPLAFEAFHIPEPKLVFGNGYTSVDPKTGLDLYGPFDVARSSGRSVMVGIVGTGDGIQEIVQYLQKAKSKISPGFNSKGNAYDPRCFPFFPGVNNEASFRCDFATDARFQRVVRELDIKAALSQGSQQKQLNHLVGLLVSECAALVELEQGPDVIVITLPDIVRKEFGPQGNIALKKREATPVQKLKKKVERRASKQGLMVIPNLLQGLDDSSDGEDEAWNIHHAIKAHCMKLGTPTQLIWESTLRGVNVSQDPASIAWNIFTGLYYKSNHSPWQLQSLPDNTCYVGISFYRDSPVADADMQTSLAQVFGAGEGLVLKGEKAVVDKKRDKQAHLTESGAKTILERAIKIFTTVNQQPPKRVVVHKTSRYWPEELRGFEEAIGDIRYHDFLALETLAVSTRMMRVGKNPPLRGTVVKLAPRHYLVYTVGYIPFLNIYPGMRTPRPIEILEHHGDSTSFDVCKEIIALTKLNWNSCSFANSEPITISFAKSVGKILAQLPSGVQPQSKYRFYM